jgi:hypothetical protein
MNIMSRKNNNNRNRNHNGRGGGGGHQRNRNNQKDHQKSKENKEDNRRVPLKYETRKGKDPPTVELKYMVDNRTIKENMVVFEDGTPEEMLKLVREFQNLVDTYNLWHVAPTVTRSAVIVYSNFCWCLKGNAREILDVIIANRPRTAAQFQVQMKQLIKKHIGQNALQNQVLYLETTRKPESMSVLQWINRINNINICLPLMAENAVKLTEYELSTKVIARNIPPSWVRPIHLMELHLKETVEDMLDKLLIIEAQYKDKKPQHQKHAQGKHFKNPFRVHNGTHEWDDCRQNPKNQRSNNREDKDNRDSKRERGHVTNGRSREEQRNTEDRDACRQRRARAAEAAKDSDEYESNCLKTEKDNGKATPSSEILVTIPRDKGSKKYRTYLGLIDTGSSSSLLSKTVVENTAFTIENSAKKTLWDTQAGSFKTNSFVLFECYFLPQFTKQRKLTNTFHLFDKLKEDGYDIIIGRDILKDMGLQIHYDMESFI